MLLKLFIPTWKFFDQLGTVSRIYYCLPDSPGAPVWLPVFEKPKRNFMNLFFNPAGNLYLAYVALIDRLVVEVGSNPTLSADQIEKLESYQLVENMLQVLLRRKNLIKGLRFQFKIQVHSGDGRPEDYLLSKDLVI